MTRLRFFLGAPFVGTERRIHKFICDQLRSRDETCLDGWGSEGDRREFALRCCALIRRALEWPNALFIPEDPVEILAWDRRSVVIDEFRTAVLVEELEKAAGLPKQTDAVWEEAGGLTLGQLVDWLLAMSPSFAKASEGGPVVRRGAGRP